MKEIISAVVLVVAILGGSRVLSDLYLGVRKAALEKASKGLSSLTEMNQRLHRVPKSAQPTRLLGVPKLKSIENGDR